MALDRKEIVENALQLLNEVGMDKLSTRALAARLGVAQPALYWHFANKSELLDALNAEVLARYHTRRMPKPKESWDDFTLATARSFRLAMLAVRDGARINAGTRPDPAQFDDAEQQLKLYVDAGFTAEAALHVSITIARFVVGFVLEEQAEKEREIGEAQGHEAGVIDELSAYPLLSVAIGPLVAAGSINSEAVFEGGLQFLLAGFRAKLAEMAGKAGKKQA